jgi:GNAT superfamily N-acetyltransferase
MPFPFTHRLAQHADIPALQILMDAAIGQLQRNYLTPDEIEASRSVMGLDTHLIDDGTYFVVAGEIRMVGCGGWSRRATLFGGDHSAGRSSAVLDPARDTARVRAMYTHPDFARRGVGRLILGLCEHAAAAEGFKRLELGATLAGEPLYRACGHAVVERLDADTPSGIRVPILRMQKSIFPSYPAS